MQVVFSRTKAKFTGGFLAILLASCYFSLPSFAADQAVMTAFAEADLYAGQEKQYPNEASARKGSAQSIQQIKAIIAKLNQPEQLVELITKCNAETAQIPSSSKFQPYCNYFVFVQEFAISRLGEMKTPDAARALETVHSIVGKSAQLMETWTEAKENQVKF